MGVPPPPVTKPVSNLLANSRPTVGGRELFFTITKILYIQFVVSFHKYDKIFAFDLHGLYNGSPDCKRPHRSSAHILSSTKRVYCGPLIYFIFFLMSIIMEHNSDPIGA